MGVIIRPDAGLKCVLKGKAVKELGAFCLQISLTSVCVVTSKQPGMFMFSECFYVSCGVLELIVFIVDLLDCNW